MDRFEGQREKRTYKGYTPYTYQRAVHKQLDGAFGKGKVVVVKARRQCGKSMMIENELLRYAIHYNKSVNCCVSPTLKQSKKMYKEIVDAISAGQIIKAANATDLEITLINGSKISFKSAEQGDAALRGFTIKGLLCIDEGAYIPDEIFYIILPWCDYHKAPILAVSTPKMKTGWFYDYFMRGVTGNENITSIDWTDQEFQEDLNKVLPPSKIAEYKKLLPASIFKTEYLGEFIDDGGSVFSVKEWYDKFDSEYNDLYVGIDWACGSENQDYTAIVGFNEIGEQVLLEYWNDIDDPLLQIDKIASILIQNKNKIKKITAEKNSIGDTFIKLLRKAVKWIPIDEFETSNPSKRTIIEKLVAGLGEGHVKLQNDKQQKTQFGAYQMEITRGGFITYNGAYGTHDDICMASAIAYNSMSSTYGHYSISVLGKRKYKKAQ